MYPVKCKKYYYVRGRNMSVYNYNIVLILFAYNINFIIDYHIKNSHTCRYTFHIEQVAYIRYSEQRILDFMYQYYLFYFPCIIKLFL